MELDKKIGNLTAQKQQLKLEISDLEDGLLEREELLNKVNGALELANTLLNEIKNEDKKDA